LDSGSVTNIPVNSFLQYDYGSGDLDARKRFTVMLHCTLPLGKSLRSAAA
jgi:hypothetical protein